MIGFFNIINDRAYNIIGPYNIIKDSVYNIINDRVYNIINDRAYNIIGPVIFHNLIF